MSNKGRPYAMTDQEILHLFENTNSQNQAFSLLLDKYQSRIYWHIRKLLIDHEDSDDVCQETFIKVFKNLGTFQNQSNLFTWIYRIATNEALNFLKKKKQRFFLPIHDYTETLQAKLDDGSLLNGSEIEIKLQKAILTLPEKQRVVFNLKYFEELDYNSISEILNTSVGALKASYHHATEKIKKYLQEDLNLS